ncbi:DUF1902 domain-containing protein [Methylomarinum sp. Ch1-1]|uniref:DUF1902 domain-containing protein n=1 Tax=Methylomarinum roseum TaxID=3067653 RepID=A0AAU7NPZ8_9GAMM|nr:DUF1902 domain-containing protein [Methylomarinum sp. Ch1-1]MDP4521023.1 DUF1902 domain-containing protein [Methylomarinum sp. Ch1-1]
MNARPNSLVLRGYAECKDGQWQAFCLDLCLAAQDDTLDGAHEKLRNMICEYVYDATVGEDKAFARQLLNRKAPLQYWVKYYIFLGLSKIGAVKDKARTLLSDTLPLAPMCNHHH